MFSIQIIRASELKTCSSIHLITRGHGVAQGPYPGGSMAGIAQRDADIQTEFQSVSYWQRISTAICSPTKEIYGAVPHGEVPEGYHYSYILKCQFI